MPEHIWKDVDDKITFKNTNPVGSGPITEVTAMRDNQVEICRNPNYYKADEGLPYLDCIKFRQYSDNSQIQPALMAGEIDWGANFIADVESTYVARDPDNHGFWYPANDMINIYLNTREAPFSDLAFRQAFSMALDRDAIVDLAAYGYPLRYAACVLARSALSGTPFEIRSRKLASSGAYSSIGKNPAGDSAISSTLPASTVIGRICGPESPGEYSPCMARSASSRPSRPCAIGSSNGTISTWPFFIPRNTEWLM